MTEGASSESAGRVSHAASGATPSVTTAAALESAQTPLAPLESRDYWDMVFLQLRRKLSYRIGLSLLTLLYGLAIFAPFVANDRPLVFEGTDYGAYRAAHRLLPLTANDLAQKLRGGQPAFEDWQAAQLAKAATLKGEEAQQWLERQAEAPLSLEAWLGGDLDALRLRVGLLRRQLSEADAAPLAELQRLAEEAVALAIGVVAATPTDAGAEGLPGDADLPGQAGAGQSAEPLSAHLDELARLASQVRSELRAAKYDTEAEPGRSVALVPFRSYPVLASLSASEVGFMVFWLLVASAPLWGRAVDAWWLGGDRARRRAARRPKCLAVLLLPILAGGAFALWPGTGSGDFETTTLKQALSQDRARAVSVSFAPLPYGMSEQNDTEHFRGPTWDADWHKDDEGYFANAGLGDRVDPSTGIPIRGEPTEVRVGEAGRNAASRHWLGTDSLGRDMLARMVWGARISLSVGLVSTILLVFLGTLIGALAGYYGGLVDVVISRLIEIFQCFPVFFLILIVVSFLGPSILNIMLAIGLFRWTGVARLVRGEFLRLRHQEFVLASEALGVRSARTIFRHVLPNALGPVLVAATFAVASGILTESALSFLGFGVQLPIPSWGSLLVESRNPEYWWIQVFPGLAVFVTVLLYNLVGEAVRDALDPRLKEA